MQWRSQEFMRGGLALILNSWHLVSIILNVIFGKMENADPIKF